MAKKKKLKILGLIICICITMIIIIIAGVVNGFTAMLEAFSIGNNGESSIYITIEVDILSDSNVSFKVNYGGTELKFNGTKNGNTISGAYNNKKGMIPMELPSAPAELSKFVIEPCNAITNTSAPAYKIVHGEGSKDDGVYRKYNGSYLVALGTYYSKNMGDKFILEFIQPDGTIKKIDAVIGDQKADIHTDPKHQFQKYDHSVVEFITAKGTEYNVSATHNKVNSDFGTLKAIYKNEKINMDITGVISGSKVTFNGTINGTKFTASGELSNNKITASGYIGNSVNGGSGKYAYPLPNKVSITSEYGYRIHPVTGEKSKMHYGVDLGALFGTPVLAADGGTVIFAGQNGGYGNCVIIDHGSNNFTLYGHMSRISVLQGRKVTKGQKIGEVGSSGISSGPHLHFEIRKGGNDTSYTINPVPEIGA